MRTRLKVKNLNGALYLAEFTNGVLKVGFAVSFVGRKSDYSYGKAVQRIFPGVDEVRLKQMVEVFPSTQFQMEKRCIDWLAARLNRLPRRREFFTGMSLAVARANLIYEFGERA